MRFCFEERIEDKDESIELYETVSNNNENKVEQKRECIESKLSGKVDRGMNRKGGNSLFLE